MFFLLEARTALLPCSPELPGCCRSQGPLCRGGHFIPNPISNRQGVAARRPLSFYARGAVSHMGPVFFRMGVPLKKNILLTTRYDAEAELFRVGVAAMSAD